MGQHAATMPAQSEAIAATLSAAWSKLDERYRNGTCAENMSAAPLEQPPELAYEPSEISAGGTPPSVDGCAEGSPAFVQTFFREMGHMPPLFDVAREEERRRVLRRFSLYDVGRVPAIDELAILARDIFDVPSTVINVVLDKDVAFVASSGWDKHETDADAPRIMVPKNDSFCPHAMNKREGSGCFQVPDALEDWRFHHGPLVRDGEGPVRFFASSNIYLPVLDRKVASADTMPIGSVCLMDPKPRTPLNDKQQRILQKLASMAGKEFILAFEQERRRIAQRRQDYLGELFGALIVFPSRNMLSNPNDLPCDLSGIATKLAEHTSSDFAFILDLRSFNGPSFDTPPATPTSAGQGVASPEPSRPQTPTSTPFSSRSTFNRLRHSTGARRRDSSVHGPGSLAIMDVECGRSDDPNQRHKEEWEKRVNSQAGLEAITQALREWYKTGETTFHAPLPSANTSSPVLPTPLVDILAPDVTAVIGAPVFDHEGEPTLYVVVGSRQKHFQFETADAKFVQGVGAMLVAGLLQEKILAADQAKLAFVSQVSHELRTPMFAIGSQLELIRTMTEPSALQTIEPLLDVAETCLTSLREVLDDTLDLSKLSDAHSQAKAKVKLVPVELEALCIDVVKSCFHKAKRLAAIRAEERVGDSSAVEKVDILLKSNLPARVQAKVDVGGLKRVLINLFGNALKFTSQGSITFTLSMNDDTCDQGTHHITFEVADTGKGMAPEFLRDCLFVAFRQEDSFTNGAGLGVSIAESIVKRLGGTLRYRSALKRGTTATVTLPLEIVSASPIDQHLVGKVRNLSEELAALFDPQSRTASRSATPLPSPDKASPHSAARSASDPSPLPDAVSPGTAMQHADVPAAERIRCLVVDDNPIARRILVTYLKSRRVQYAEASGGAQAVELFESFEPNIVWCDIQMPGVDGIEATRRMRELEKKLDRPRARIVAISGLDSTLGEHSSVLTSGQVDHWLVKSGSSLRALAADMLEFSKTLVKSADATASTAKAVASLTL
ncbi:hypothetical protein Rhopal_000736-T1 [Rhodotorula paludigena]|uniref:histidine kinase n=1 Tax=Rhodotorula paludigena TaxID=86838 RepID=A0AAV5G5I2_9BASI|nr:hypothetical protein Rhopal_000736-T1 [Rhodotorula paludigena]